MVDVAIVEVLFIDTGDHIHRRLRLQDLEQEFVTENCQTDQQKTMRLVSSTEARRLMATGEREGCSFCRPTLPVEMTLARGPQPASEPPPDRPDTTGPA